MAKAIRRNNTGKKGLVPMKEHLFEDAYVTVTQGILHGTVENGIKVFRGVPYAASPVGDRRWKAPPR